MFDIYSLDKAAKQDEEGVQKAAKESEFSSGQLFRTRNSVYLVS